MFSRRTSTDGTWVTYPLTGLNYLGDWDVDNNLPFVLPGGVYLDSQQNRMYANVGDYFIVSNDGVTYFDFNTQVNWGVGDWIIFNGTTWEQIKNSGSVSRSFGEIGHVDRFAGIYEWAQVIKRPDGHVFTPDEQSSFGDFSDVDISFAQDQDVIKWDPSTQKWISGTDLVGVSLPLETAEIEDEAINNDHVAENANISASKIVDGTGTTFDTLIGNKVDSNGGNIGGSSAQLNLGSSIVSLMTLHCLQVEG